VKDLTSRGAHRCSAVLGAALQVYSMERYPCHRAGAVCAVGCCSVWRVVLWPDSTTFQAMRDGACMPNSTASF
jgi:Zn-finger protein